MIWIPITLLAALAQTMRNAAQRHLVGELGTLGATLVRFLYGLPFGAAWLALAAGMMAQPIPAPTISFLAWALTGAVTQIAGTAFLLRTMHERTFAVGVAYSKTEVLQVALFGLLLLGETLSVQGMLAVASGTLGVLLLAPANRERPLRSLIEGFVSRSALLGLACGGCMALSSVAFRGATRSLDSPAFLVNAAATVAVVQFMQTVLLGGWLAIREPATVTRTLKAWRVSLFAGFMGAAASASWFTAFAIKPVASVRTLGLSEMVFSYFVARRYFREQLTLRELAAIALLVAGMLLIAVEK